MTEPGGRPGFVHIMGAPLGATAMNVPPGGTPNGIDTAQMPAMIVEEGAESALQHARHPSPKSLRTLRVAK